MTEQVDYQAILFAMSDAVTVRDQAFRIVYQNPAMKRLIGDCSGGLCCDMLEGHTGNTGICPNCSLRRCFQDGEIHEQERLVIKNGERCILERTASPIKDDSGAVVATVGVVRDVTLRRQSEAQLTRFMNMYAALSHTNKAIMECTHPDEMFKRVCHAVVGVGKFSLAVIGLTDQDGVVRSVAHSGAAARYLDSLVVQADARQAEAPGPTGRAIRDGVAYICNDFHNDPITTPWRTAALSHGIRASAAFPLKLQGAVVGALKVYSDQVNFFDGEIIDLLTELAANVSFGLENFSREKQRRESAEALRKSEEQLKLVLEGSNDGYCDWLIPTSTLRMSARYLEMLGYAPGEIEPVPQAIKRLIHPEDWPRFELLIDEEMARITPAFEIEARTLTKRGEWKWILYRGKVVERDENGTTTRVAGTCSDITEKKLFEEKLSYASTHDQMSGLYNRAYFDAEIARVRSGRNFPVSIVMADVDGLKLVNDTLGHAAGDRLIQLAAELLRNSFRTADVVARIGGDEFGVVLVNADASIVKEAVKRVLAAASLKSSGDLSLSISIGSATADNPEELGEALRQADARMYHYKFRRKAERQTRQMDKPAGGVSFLGETQPLPNKVSFSGNSRRNCR